MSEPTWELLGGGGAVGGPIDYIGVWSAGATYQPGQIVRHNGFDYLSVNPSTGVTPPAVAIPPLSPGVSYATSLPTPTFDGQEAILVDSLTAPTYSWRFRYNAGSSSAYKWEFVGGPPIRGGRGGSVNNNTMTPIDVGCPPLTVPRAGVYRFLWSVGVLPTTFASIYGSIAQLYSGGLIGANNPFNYHASLYAGGMIVGDEEITLAASAVVTMRGWNDRVAASGGTTLFEQAWVTAIPVRVA